MLDPTTPTTEAGRALWESMTGGDVHGPFGASARMLGSELLAIEAEARADERRRLAGLVEGLPKRIRHHGIVFGQYPAEYDLAGQWTAIVVGSPEPHGNGATPTEAIDALCMALSDTEPAP